MFLLEFCKCCLRFSSEITIHTRVTFDVAFHKPFRPSESALQMQ